MIEISGTAKIRVDYSIELDMTEEVWDDLTEKQQNEKIENHVDWMDACRSGEVDDIEVDEVNEFDDEEEPA